MLFISFTPMNEQELPKIAKWPFLAGDALLLVVAFLVVYLSNHPLGLGQIWVCFFSVLGGACLSALPFLIEYKAAGKLYQTGQLKSAVEQIQNLELISCQISTSLEQLHTVLEECAKTVSTSGSLSDRITAEARSFKEFLENANDSEKATLRLEVDKMRRSESDWLQVITGILDHVFALHQAAVRSSQPELAHQIGLFQRACRDMARRVGLVPFAPEEKQPFDPNLHHLADTESTAEKDAPITRILATGYTYQGQMVRRALVSVDAQASKNSIAPPRPDSQDATGMAPRIQTTVSPKPESTQHEPAPADLSIADINSKVQQASTPPANPKDQDGLLL
jgi:molecular chaperone GrpE (heat shock protein)